MLNWIGFITYPILFFLYFCAKISAQLCFEKVGSAHLFLGERDFE